VIESHPSRDLEQSSGKTRVYVSTSTRSTKQKVLDSWSEYGLQLCAVNAPGRWGRLSSTMCFAAHLRRHSAAATIEKMEYMGCFIVTIVSSPGIINYSGANALQRQTDLIDIIGDEDHSSDLQERDASN
jgi:hypothetical protein